MKALKGLFAFIVLTGLVGLFFGSVALMVGFAWNVVAG